MLEFFPPQASIFLGLSWAWVLAFTDQKLLFGCNGRAGRSSPVPPLPVTTTHWCGDHTTAYHQAASSSQPPSPTTRVLLCLPLPLFLQKRTWAEFDSYLQAAGLDGLVQYTAKRRYDEHCQASACCWFQAGMQPLAHLAVVGSVVWDSSSAAVQRAAPCGQDLCFLGAGAACVLCSSKGRSVGTSAGSLMRPTHHLAMFCFAAGAGAAGAGHGGRRPARQG